MCSLSSLVLQGKLVLSCPTCQSKHWKLSSNTSALVCGDCSMESDVIFWIEKIKEIGDYDPYIALILRGDKGGVCITVDTTHRNSKDGETIRFSNLFGDGHSVSTLEVLTTVVSSFQKRAGTDTVFHQGVGGTLLISHTDGQTDVSMKTENLFGGKLHGAEVFFPKNHEIFPYLQKLKQAMLQDLRTTKI